MDHRGDSTDDRVLSVRLDVQLDRHPIVGLLCTERGAEERFVGWLGFVETLQRLHDSRAPAQRRLPAVREPRTEQEE